MDEIAALRNFKDFLLIYNRMTENCFSRCVDSLNQRNLTGDEERCVDKCANKQVNINHKIMAIYMEVQPEMAKKRGEELEKQMQANITESPSLDLPQPSSDISNTVDPE